MASHQNNNVRIGSGDGRSDVGVSKGVGSRYPDIYESGKSFFNISPSAQKARIDEITLPAILTGGLILASAYGAIKGATGGGGSSLTSKKGK
jgi:hypothetical protein